MTDEQKIAEFLEKGGQVKKCPPGPSENVVYISGPRHRRFDQSKTEKPPAPPAD